MFISWAGRIININSIDVINGVFEYRYPYRDFDGSILPPSGQFFYTLNMLRSEKDALYYSNAFDNKKDAEEDRDRFIAKIDELKGVKTY